MIKRIVCLVVVVCGVMACGGKLSPKPYEYFRIDLPEHSYRLVDSLPNLSFEVHSMTSISDAKEANIRGYNIDYQQLNGRIYLTYLPINIDSFVRVTEDCRTLAYKHSIKANSIIENYYSNDTTKVYGVMFEITGNAASPLQFFITDSLNNFLRGSVYFNNLPNYDSIMPVAKYVEQDVVRLIESVRWK